MTLEDAIVALPDITIEDARRIYGEYQTVPLGKLLKLAERLTVALHSVQEHRDLLRSKFEALEVEHVRVLGQRDGYRTVVEDMRRAAGQLLPASAALDTFAQQIGAVRDRWVEAQNGRERAEALLRECSKEPITVCKVCGRSVGETPIHNEMIKTSDLPTNLPSHYLAALLHLGGEAAVHAAHEINADAHERARLNDPDAR